MQPTFALVIAMALTAGRSASRPFADDVPRSGPRRRISPQGTCWADFRKPATPEVPPNPPRQVPPKATPEGPAQLPLDPPALDRRSDARPARLEGDAPGDPDRLEVHATAPVKRKDSDVTIQRAQATAADLGAPIGPGSDSTSISARCPAASHSRFSRPSDRGPDQQPRPDRPSPRQPRDRLRRGRRGRPALPRRPQPDRLHRLSTHHPDPQRHLRQQSTAPGPAGSGNRLRHRHATPTLNSFYH